MEEDKKIQEKEIKEKGSDEEKTSADQKGEQS